MVASCRVLVGSIFRHRVTSAEIAVAVHPEASAIEVIRQDLDLTGTKLVCGAGACGACTVRFDDRPATACLLPAYALDDRDHRALRR